MIPADCLLPTASCLLPTADCAFCCKSSLSEQRRLIRDDPESFFVPAYLGSKGWIAIRLDLDDVDWDTVAELAQQAYQAIAPKKLAAMVE